MGTPAFALRLFGAPALLAPDAHPPAGLTSKCVALLAYLALEPRAHTREELAAMFWGDSPEEAARTSLRQALKHLRDTVGDALEVDRRLVRLARPLPCDALDFLRAAEHDPALAAEFDVPSFLSGFTPRGAPAFEEWTAAQRARLLARYHQALGILARRAFADSRWREAAAWAERWVSSDPSSDEANRLAIEAMYLAGDRAAALARYGAYRTRLEREMGCEPSAALRELARRIDSDRAVELRQTYEEEAEPGGPGFTSSMVGREREWRALKEAWKASVAGRGRVLLIEGDVGLGKSRLADEFLQWAHAEGATALRGRAYDPQTDVPFGPVAEALRGALEAPGLGGTDPEWLTEASRLLPELRRRFPGLPEAPPPSDPGDRWRLFEAVTQILLALAAERPTVLLIDDLHWADGESCALLRAVTRRLEGSPILVVATFTAGELERDAPAARLIRALHTEPLTVSVVLAPLDEHGVWRMVREMGHLKSPEGGRRFAQKVHAVTGGNPFYTIELLKTLFAQGLLTATPVSREWVVHTELHEGEARIQMPTSVRDAVGERVSRLPYELRDLLATAAITGRGAPAALFSHVHGISRMRAAALADALIERHLMVENDGLYRCAHQVITEVVREQLTASRRQELHRAVALAYEAIGRPERDDVAGEIAWHAYQGGEAALAYRSALRASEAATRRYAFEEALSWLDIASETAGTPEEEGEVNRRTARVLELAGWTQPPARAQRRSAAVRQIAKSDLDLRPAPA